MIVRTEDKSHLSLKSGGWHTKACFYNSPPKQGELIGMKRKRAGIPKQIASVPTWNKRTLKKGLKNK